MDWERISANWPHWRERIQRRWGRLTREQLDAVAGRREKLLAHIQEQYELGRVDADRQLTNWERNLAVEEFTEISDGTSGRGFK